jgi:hypothetical protein
MYSYNSSTSTLTIQIMTSRMHDAIVSIFAEEFYAIRRFLPDLVRENILLFANLKQNAFCWNVTAGATIMVSAHTTVSQAELPETFPWRQIGASQSVWPLFAQPELLVGRKVYSTRVLAPSSSLLSVP